MSIIQLFKNYKPPKKLRALFIIHYAPILLMILIGPITPIYGIWKLQSNVVISIIIGIIIFIIGALVYFKWELFWEKNYHGQLITEGIFRYIRHPHYTSLLIIGFGLAFFFNSISALIIAIIAVPIMIISIIDEEKLLIKQYGKEYIEFMKKTPWKIVPYIF
jgi:protein-S-isoprenylcysteine O-methyltransferase Ste14